MLDENGRIWVEISIKEMWNSEGSVWKCVEGMEKKRIPNELEKWWSEIVQLRFYEETILDFECNWILKSDEIGTEVEWN